MRAPAIRTSSPNLDAVGLVVALLVRFTEIVTIASHPAGSIVLSFAIKRRLERTERERLREAVGEHVRTLLEMGGESAPLPLVTCEVDDGLTFVRVACDAHSFTREQLTMLTSFFAERYGDALLRGPAQDEPLDEEPSAADEMVDCAIEALRDPSRQKSLVGFREEKRVLVYFLKARKKAKAAAR